MCPIDDVRRNTPAQIATLLWVLYSVLTATTAGAVDLAPVGELASDGFGWDIAVAVRGAISRTA